jgi:hypothetical protein
MWRKKERQGRGGEVKGKDSKNCQYWVMSGKLYAPAALSRGMSPRRYWTRDWVGPRDGVEAVVMRKSLSPPGIKSECEAFA